MKSALREGMKVGCMEMTEEEWRRNLNLLKSVMARGKISTQILNIRPINATARQMASTKMINGDRDLRKIVVD